MPENKIDSSHYYNIAQFRVESWNDLKNESTKLYSSPRGSEDEKLYKKNLRQLLKDIEGVECYFAFPGLSCLESLREMLDRHEHTALSNKIAEITKNLVSDRYRSNPDFLEDDDPTVEIGDKGDRAEVSRKTYFEVMFVEDVSQAEDSKLRHDLKELRLSNEQFAYG
ncbi:MAG: ornithine decarboxylase, partial [Salegentibacter mishustinae]|nr:ornithine decarboxylase [Salegentibacter mishustinae]